VTQADERDRVLQRYLLGSLTEADELRLEREYLAVPAAQDRLLLIEGDLVEAYVAGRLTTDERAQLEARFLLSPRGRRRVLLARSLACVPPRRGESRVWAPQRRRLIAGAALAVAASVLWPWPRAATVGPITLRPGLARGAGVAAPVHVPPRAQVLVFELELPADWHARYRVELLGEAAEVRWTAGGLTSYPIAHGRAVAVAVAAALLGRGEQTFTLAPDTATYPIAAYAFTIAP
jgi:hypothetical protein